MDDSFLVRAKKVLVMVEELLKTEGFLVGRVGDDFGGLFVSENNHDILVMFLGQVHALIHEGSLLVVEIVGLLSLRLISFGERLEI
jgi:hypothetical protein